MSINMADLSICQIDACAGKLFARGLCRKHYSNADFRPVCRVDGCARKADSHGLCSMHRRRELRNGNIEKVQRPANGTRRRWLEEHVSYTGDDCLIWPFWRDKHGYGPSREMCALAHGEPPTPDHQSAHSCGNGHLGCMNPRHLRWATRAENQAEMAEHGNSQRGAKNFFCKLTEDQVQEIRKVGYRESDSRLAARFGVSRKTISDVRNGRSWAWLD